MTGNNNNNAINTPNVNTSPVLRYFCCCILLISLCISYCDGYMSSNIATVVTVLREIQRNHPRQQVRIAQSSVPSTPSLAPRRQRFNSGMSVSPRIKRIKDTYQTREIVNDITACEFALIVDTKTNKAKIDYGMLIAKLDKDSVLLAQRDIDGDKQLNDRLIELKVALLKKLERMETAFTGSILSASSAADIKDNYSVKYGAIDHGAVSGNVGEVVMSTEGSGSGSNLGILEDSNINATELNIPALRISVREDGTVDWEDTIASGTEVAKFGTQLWERLNGKESTAEGLSIAELLKPVPAKMVVTPEIERLDGRVNATKLSLQKLSMERDVLKNRLREGKSNGKEISFNDLQELRLFDFRCKEEEKRLKLISLDRDMELICVCLEQEVESSLDPGDQKMFLAQVGLVERQLSNIMSGLPSLEEIENENYPLDPENPSFSSLVDDDELGLIVSQVNDLKMRLSLDSQKTEVDWGTLGIVYRENMAKFKEGLEFYSEGSKMIANDIQYAWNLLLKAVTGYTLKPREVNSIRRIAKDLFTLIPFTIILIIPLSPIGHVLVFSFIQRFFPDFFPSGFTEKRHNIRRLFAEIEGAGNDDIADLLSPGYGSGIGGSSVDDQDRNIFDVRTLRSKMNDVLKIVTTGLQMQQDKANVTSIDEKDNSGK